VTKPHKIHNVIPMDFDGDGRLDLLVMSEAEDGTWWTDTSELQLDVHVQVEGGKLGVSRCESQPQLCRRGLTVRTRSDDARLASEIGPCPADDR
jgi:hypothetical protein